jgi:hypothetical protein
MVTNARFNFNFNSLSSNYRATGAANEMKNARILANFSSIPATAKLFLAISLALAFLAHFNFRHHRQRRRHEREIEEENYFTCDKLKFLM